MFLSLGKNNTIFIKDIITIINFTKLPSTQKAEYLSKNKNNYTIVDISDSNPKSLILTNNKNKNILYFTSVTTDTIYKKIQYLNKKTGSS